MVGGMSVMDYHCCNGCKRFYIGGSMVKGLRRVHRMRVGGIMILGVILIVWVCLIL